jgi:hypothetical protein
MNSAPAAASSLTSSPTSVESCDRISIFDDRQVARFDDRTRRVDSRAALDAVDEQLYVTGPRRFHQYAVRSAICTSLVELWESTQAMYDVSAIRSSRCVVVSFAGADALALRASLQRY